MDIKQKVLRQFRRRGLFLVKKDVNATRWGIIGLGNMAEVFATVLDASKENKIAAVASRDITKAQAFASRHGKPKAYGSYSEMLCDKALPLDVVYIATPVVCHYEDIKMALLAGRNVLCEKPITCKTSQLKELQVIAKEQGCFLMEGMWMKCLPVFRCAKQIIKDGKIGDVELIRVDFYKREMVDTGRSIFKKNEKGGVLMDYGIYAVAFASEFLGGAPDNIRYEVRRNADGIDTDWSVVLNRGETRAIINVSSDFSSASKAIVIGSKGSIEWNSQFNRTNSIKLFDTLNRLQKEITLPYSFDGYEYEVAHVRECLKNDMQESNIVPLQSSMESLIIVDAIKKRDRLT